MRAPRCAGLQQSTLRSPPVMAPAMRKVPASMRSGLMRWRAPWSLATPLTLMVEVPAPSILAPMALSSAARSVTSGSRAQFSKTVSPSARVGGHQQVFGAGDGDLVEDDVRAFEAAGSVVGLRASR